MFAYILSCCTLYISEITLKAVHGSLNISVYTRLLRSISISKKSNSVIRIKVVCAYHATNIDNFLLH